MVRQRDDGAAHPIRKERAHDSESGETAEDLHRGILHVSKLRRLNRVRDAHRRTN